MRGDHGALEGRGAVQTDAHALTASEYLAGERTRSLAQGDHDGTTFFRLFSAQRFDQEALESTNSTLFGEIYKEAHF